ncbi:MAG: xanthine dehydrogenase family protein molybdopterin-binding subunit [Rhodospirillales bacterium]|nr:xanthine dehydrogenase family protein molybdopterin-binding subunit [Rhodospirillales bacterium]
MTDHKFQKIGQPTRRKEDFRLLTGRGEFSDDFNLPGQAVAVMIRSPYPHARIVSIDKAEAESMPGVLGIFTGADCEAEGLTTGIPHNPIPKTNNDLKLTGPGGGVIFIGPHVLLPTDKARHVGEAVAMVVAETRHQAMDAAEAVFVEYEELPFVTDTAAAAEANNISIWDEVPDNVPVDTTFGDVRATEDIFANADHIAEMDFHIVRVTGVTIEPRAALGNFDAKTGRYTLYAGSGGAVRQKREIEETLGIEEDSLRVISKDVGGNFGTRNRVYVEFPLILWASRKLGRPVKFVSERSESFISDYQGRDLVTKVELALDKEGFFLAMRASNISNVGARIVSLSPLGKGTALITGNYHIPHAYARARAVFSNTPPTQAYRSSGRPEVTFAIERLIDTAAHDFGFDPIDIRRKNLIRPDMMPYQNPIGALYDSGEYEKSMDMAMELADLDGFTDRKREAESRGRLLGLGFANYVESSTGAPIERAEITVRSEGIVDVVIGTQPAGQGHETSFAQVAAEWLGVPIGQINIILGDTDVVKVGGGSHSGRSMRMAGTVIVQTADKLIEKGKQIAAHLFDSDIGDVEFNDGVFSAEGTNKSMTLFELARGSELNELPEPLRGPLAVGHSNEMHTQVFPNGAHICEIEVDPETGGVEIKRYVAIDDVGRAINPLIVDGQTHGGIAQGVGQALLEQCYMDPESGQPLCGSLVDYGLPRADHFPSFKTRLNEVHSPTNPLGIKAGGEGGTTPALAVVINAIVNALRPYGVRDVKMPATPLTVWQAIQDARSSFKSPL